jgi:hypothetical protein
MQPGMTPAQSCYFTSREVAIAPRPTVGNPGGPRQDDEYDSHNPEADQVRKRTGHGLGWEDRTKRDAERVDGRMHRSNRGEVPP